MHLHRIANDVDLNAGHFGQVFFVDVRWSITVTALVFGIFLFVRSK